MAETGVYKLENGFWAYRFIIKVNGKSIVSRKTKDENGQPFKTEKSASRARQIAIIKAQEEGGIKPKRQRVTVEEVYNLYKERGRGDRAYNTIKKQESLWNNHIKERFGKRYIDEISVGEIKDYLTELYYKVGYSYRYTESFLKMFYLIFGQAYSRNLLDGDIYNFLCKNKDTKISMPKLKVDDDMDIVAFDNDERNKLEVYFTGTNAETAYRLGRYCGLRINECYGLKWGNVNLEEGTIKIDRQMQYQDGLIKLVPLKTRNARRTIYLSNRMRDFFSKLKAQYFIDKKELSKQRAQNQTYITDIDGKKISSLELVNTLPNGKIQTVNSMKYHSRTIKAKFNMDFKFHYLRHTYGTIMAELNTPVHLLENQMGHANIHITQRYYIALSKSGIEILQENLNRL